MSNIEKRSAAAFFAFGRFQPPTVGHAVLINAVADAAAAAGGDAYVFVSQSQNKYAKYTRAEKKLVSNYQNNRTRNAARQAYRKTNQTENPLPVERKIYYLKKMFPGTGVRFIDTAATETQTIYKAITALQEAGYESITLFRGTDREGAFSREKMGSIGVNVATVERNESSKNIIRGMSGTKMRQAAIDGDLATLRAGIKMGNITDKNVEDLMENIRRGIFEPVGVPAASRNRSRSRNRGRRA
jgi:hypothetical protein